MGRFIMAKLIYSAITSLDGYIADEDGNFDWAAPDEEVHTFVDQRPVMQDFAKIWQAADKVVYSRTLAAVSSARTRIERDFDPEAVRQLKASAGRDLSVGGPDLAAQAIRAGLVDEFHLFLTPFVVGGGNQSLPDNVRVQLELLDERRFGGGVVFLRYRTRT